LRASRASRLLLALSLSAAAYALYPYLSYAWFLRDPHPEDQIDVAAVQASLTHQLEQRLGHTEGPPGPPLRGLIRDLTSDARLTRLLRGCGELPPLPAVSMGPGSDVGPLRADPDRAPAVGPALRPCSRDLEWMFFRSWDAFEVRTSEVSMRMELRRGYWIVTDFQLRRLEPSMRSQNLQ